MLHCIQGLLQREWYWDTLSLPMYFNYNTLLPTSIVNFHSLKLCRYLQQLCSTLKFVLISIEGLAMAFQKHYRVLDLLLQADELNMAFLGNPPQANDATLFLEFVLTPAEIELHSSIVVASGNYSAVDVVDVCRRLK